MFHKSIRWRLSLSYASIALLTAVALGAVLLFTLYGYYRQRERVLLTYTAQAIATNLLRTDVLAMPPDDSQIILEAYASVAQSRVLLFDSDAVLLADSGPPQDRFYWLHQFQEQADGSIYAVAPFRIDRDRPVPVDQPDYANQPSYAAPTRSDGRGWLEFIVGTIPPPEATLGIGLVGETSLNGPRSVERVRVPVGWQDSDPMGFVELSEGPALGREVLYSVARAWIAASVVAVLLAAIVGWVFSRHMSEPLLALTGVTARMAEGDLSARADVRQQDEFGLLARSFNEMAQRIEGIVVALRRFVADAAHELHTPLTALRTNLELAADERDDSKRRGFIEQAEMQAERLVHLASGLLDLSRIETGEVAQELVQVNLLDLVQETGEVYASQAEQAGVAFDLDLSQEPMMVLGNETQLRRSLGNILDNAVKFTPPGGTVSMSLCSKDEWVEIKVQDSGIGIPAEELDHLYERFHRGRNAASYPGSGLGLAIVKAIVERHYGCVTAEPTADGTRFSVRIPAFTNHTNAKHHLDGDG